jgi:predicted dinucleotide-binding enzyme
LGKGWAKKGHSVTFGVRDKADPKVATLLQQAGAGARAASLKEAAGSAEVVVFATPWPATQEAIRTAGNLAGKVVLDCTNPLKADLTLEVGHTTSGGEQVAGWAQGARVVKIFNTTGFNNMEDPRYPNGPVTMFYCGDDAGTKATAAQLATDLGFEAIDAGDMTIARLLEPLATLWIHLAIRQKMGFAFALNVARR